MEAKKDAIKMTQGYVAWLDYEFNEWKSCWAQLSVDGLRIFPHQYSQTPLHSLLLSETTEVKELKLPAFPHNLCANLLIPQTSQEIQLVIAPQNRIDLCRWKQSFSNILNFNKSDQLKKGSQRTSQPSLNLNIPSTTIHSTNNSPTPNTPPSQSPSSHKSSHSPPTFHQYASKSLTPIQNHTFALPSLTLNSPHQTITITPQNAIMISPFTFSPTLSNNNNMESNGQKITISNQTITISPTSITISPPPEAVDSSPASSTVIQNVNPLTVNFDSNYEVKDINISENNYPLSFLNSNREKESLSSRETKSNHEQNELSTPKTTTISSSSSDTNMESILKLDYSKDLKPVRPTESDRTGSKQRLMPPAVKKVAKKQKKDIIEELKINSEQLNSISAIKKTSKDDQLASPSRKSNFPSSHSFHSFSGENAKSSIESDESKATKSDSGKYRSKVSKKEKGVCGNQSVTDSLSSSYSDDSTSSEQYIKISSKVTAARVNSKEKKSKEKERKERKERKATIEKDTTVILAQSDTEKAEEEKNIIDMSDRDLNTSQELNNEKIQQIIRAKIEEIKIESEIEKDVQKETIEEEVIEIITDKAESSSEKNFETNDSDEKIENFPSDQDQTTDFGSAEEIFVIHKKKKKSKAKRSDKNNIIQPAIQKDLITVDNQLSTPPLPPSLRVSRLLDEFKVSKGAESNSEGEDKNNENNDSNSENQNANLRHMRNKDKKGKRKKLEKRLRSIQPPVEEKKELKSILVKDRSRITEKKTVRFAIDENVSDAPKKLLKEKIIFPVKKKSRKSKKSNNGDDADQKNEERDSGEDDNNNNDEDEDRNSDERVDKKSKKKRSNKPQNNWVLNTTTFKVAVKNGTVSVQNPLFNSGISSLKQQLFQLQLNYRNNPQVPAALDASKSDLSSFPLLICKHDYLTICNLYSNQLKSLPPEIGNLRNLVQLGLNENSLMYLPKAIGNLSKLEILDLRYNRLQELPAEIGKLTSLKRLFVRYNRLISLPDSICKLTSLEILSVRNNNLFELPKSISCLSSLKILDVHQNQIAQLPSFRGLSDLVDLDCQCNLLSSLPDDISTLQNLKKFHIGHNKFSEFPNCICDLRCLEELDLEGNSISQLPEDINQLVNLKQLFLSRNHLTALPATFGNLIRLRQLFLSGNRLEELPASFARLKELKEVDLSTNNFTKFPNPTLLRYVITLNLQDNLITSLPENMFELISIKTLNLGENQLRALPDGFCNISSLINLRLSCNELCELPTNFDFLSSLRTLQLDNNLFEEIQPQIGFLSNLVSLSLIDNDINDLPDELVNLHKLKQLKVDGNPLECFPPGVSGGAAVFKHICERVKERSLV